MDRVLSIAEALTFAMKAGFAGEQAVTMVAIAMAESKLHTQAPDYINTDGSHDRGILQFNSRWHPEVIDSAAYDPALAFAAAYRVTANGTIFTAWNTYKKGAHVAYMPQVQAELCLLAMQQQASDVWLANSVHAQSGTGIYTKWLALYPTLNLGPPTTAEIHSVDSTGAPNVLQFFSSFHIELVNNTQYLLHSLLGQKEIE